MPLGHVSIRSPEGRISRGEQNSVVASDSALLGVHMRPRTSKSNIKYPLVCHTNLRRGRIVMADVKSLPN
jgi:hypothetical protein